MQKININLLLPQTKVIKTEHFEIFQWGWNGFFLDHNFVNHSGYDIDRIIRDILGNAEGVFFILIQDIVNDRSIFLLTGSRVKRYKQPSLIDETFSSLHHEMGAGEKPERALRNEN